MTTNVSTPTDGTATELDARTQVDEVVAQLPLPLTEPLSVDREFRTATRTNLDERSWVDFVPGWIAGSDELFREVAAKADWAQHWRRMFNQTFREPRFTAAFDSIERAPIPFIADLTDALLARYGVRYDSLWMNFYRDQRDGSGWHADRPANRPPEAIVPVISLGAPRRFLIKPKDGGKSTVFIPGPGDMIVMGGRAQRDWIHAAPKQTKPSGPRISLNLGSSEQNSQKGV